MPLGNEKIDERAAHLNESVLHINAHLMECVLDSPRYALGIAIIILVICGIECNIIEHDLNKFSYLT